MNHLGFKAEGASLDSLGLENVANAYWNLTPAELVEETIVNGQGCLTSNGALAIDTGEFMGRSPKDKFIVKDELTRDSIWWGEVNIPLSEEHFENLHNRLRAYLSGRDVYVRDASVCADEAYRLKLRVVTEFPWANLFAYNMFLRPSDEEIAGFDPEWNIVCAPGFHADPEVDGTRQHNFAAISFSKKLILIGGTGYTGEIKKGVFSILNFILPHQHKVLSMHCSANVGVNGDTAIFFGLSGTGKTTLSSDPNRRLIGDDEHGWAEDSVFNFEGGCYAKTIDLDPEKEPQIYKAIRFGALLENVGFNDDGVTPDYHYSGKTENTRVSYPIHHIDNIVEPSRAGNPRNIFFLTCDAFGVLPPISRLNRGQAMYHFISGYTAKVAGTEAGVKDPQVVFSACFGAPFLPLHPTRYAEMLGEMMDKHEVRIWLVNTGWSGGEYGVGKRMSLPITRALITAALEGELEKVEFRKHPVFGVEMPSSCPGVPDAILDPRNTWTDKEAYDRKAADLASRFVKNFSKFESFANAEIMAAAPVAAVGV